MIIVGNFIHACINIYTSIDIQYPVYLHTVIANIFIMN